MGITRRYYRLVSRSRPSGPITYCNSWNDRHVWAPSRPAIYSKYAVEECWRHSSAPSSPPIVFTAFSSHCKHTSAPHYACCLMHYNALETQFGTHLAYIVFTQFSHVTDAVRHPFWVRVSYGRLQHRTTLISAPTGRVPNPRVHNWTTLTYRIEGSTLAG